MTSGNWTWKKSGLLWKKVWNNAPNANDDAFSGDFNEPVKGNVLANDTDKDGDKLSVVSVTQPQNGTVKMFSDGNFTYTPNDGFSGTDTFTYKISDGKGGYGTAKVTITVGEDPHVADDDNDGDDTDQTPDDEDCPKGGFNAAKFDAISLNYSDAVNDSIKVSATNASSGDSVIYRNAATLEDGTVVSARLVLVEKSNKHLEVNLAFSDDYEIVLNANNNAHMGGETATFRLEFFDQETGAPVSLNPALVFADLDKNQGAEVITINDPNLLNVGVSDNSNVNVNFDGGSSVTGSGTADNIDPNLLESQFLVLYDDTSEITFTMTSRHVNSGLNFGEAVPENFNMLTNADPIAADDTYEGEFDAVITGNVLDNDTDPDKDTICVTSNTDPANGTVTVNPDGTFSYTPNTGFSGTDQFTYTISDGNGGTDTATVTLTVAEDPNPDCPKGGFNPEAFDAISLKFSEAEDGSIGVGNDNATAGDSVIYRNAATLEDGTVVSARLVLVEKSNEHLKVDLAFGDEAEILLNGNNNPNVGGETATFRLEFFDQATGTPVNLHPALVFADLDKNQGAEVITINDPNLLNVGVSDNSNVDVNFDGGSSVTGSGTVDNIDPDLLESQFLVLYDDTNAITFTMTSRDVNSGLNFGEAVPQNFNMLTNADPIAADDMYEVEFNADITGNVLDNDMDPDKDKICVISNTDPSNGTVTVNQDGTFTYTPNPDFTGTDQFTYTVTDGNGGTDTATVTLTVGAAPNSPPDAVNDAFSGNFNQPIEGDLLANDSDPDGDDLTVIGNTDPANGTVTVNPDGTFTYTPNTGFAGTDQFTYTISDGNGGTDTATVTLTVAPNTAPDAANDSFTGDFNQPIEGDVLANDSDPDGDPLTVIGNTDPLNGTVTVNPDGTFTYTPETGFAGTDQFTYTISDGNGGTDTATVTLTVGEDPNSPPDAVNDAFSGNFNQPIEGDLLANDSDPDGDDLTVIGNTDPANGTVTVNPDGTFTYTPETGFAGNDQFTYTISDGNGGTDTATVTLTVAPNTAPDAANDSFTGDFNQPIEGDVLANDSDPDGDPLTVISNTDPLNGTVTVNPDGTFTYTPETGFAGTDQFTYTISDGNGGTDTATVTLTVGERPNEAPTAVADTINGQAGEPIEGSVLDNDSDPDGDPLKVIDNTAPSNGKLVIGTDGKFIYIPDDGFAGEDSFTYTISDGNGGTDTTTVTLNVNARPEANDDIVNGQEGAPIEGAVLDNDTDADGDPLTIIGNTEPENGTLVLNEDGTFTYVPDDGFFGQDSFTYTVSDGNGGTDTATVTLNVNAGPDANDDIVNGQEGAPIEGAVLDNDTDADGDPLTIIGNTEPENGTLVLNEDGTFTYVPDDGFSGQDSFTYTVSDGNGGTDTATVTLNVNGAPVAEDDVADGAFNSAIEGAVLDNDSDPDGDDLTVIGNTAPANGSVVINANGQFVYVPNEGFSGEDSFTYTVSDGNGGTDTATVTVNVGEQPNTAPDAENDFFSGAFNQVIEGSVLDNDTDADGDPLTVIGNTDPANGTVTMNPDGTFTYTPNDGFAGEDSFTYTISDGNGGQDTATVNLFTEKECAPANRPPVAVDDEFETMGMDKAFEGNVLDNDSDPDGDPLTVKLNTQPANGTVTMQPDGSFTYKPNAGFFGKDTFEYVVSDGNGGADHATVHITVPCFAAGTLIVTAEGPKLVEDIKIGDKVLTRDDGFQQVRWAGQRTLDTAYLTRNPDFVSVLIRAGALGNQMPRRDLRVSPGHRMLISGYQAELLFGEREVLVAACDLVGQPGIEHDPRPVTYVHIMFDSHQIIDSEGAWSESFQPADVTLNGLDTQQRDELLALFPELATRKGQGEYAAARRVLARHESSALLSM